MRNRYICLAATALLAMAAFAAGAHAASFDCKTARTAMEKTICANAELSAQDDAMASAYAAARAPLSAVGRAAMRDSQRSFLHYAEAKCRQEDARTPGGWCLRREFAERTSVLKVATVQLGTHLLYATAAYRFRVAQVEVTDEKTEPFDVEEVAIGLQIDAPSSAAEVRWNQQARNRLTKAIRDAHTYADGPQQTFEKDDTTRVYVRMHLAAASRDLIVTSTSVSSYIFHTAHPREWSNDAVNWSLRLGRPLTATDLFRDTKAWIAPMQPIAQAHAQSRVSPPGPITQPLFGLNEVGRWRIRPDGLHIVYGQYELGGYLSAAETVIPWQDLKPWLRKSLPFDKATLESNHDRWS